MVWETVLVHTNSCGMLFSLFTALTAHFQRFSLISCAAFNLARLFLLARRKHFASAPVGFGPLWAFTGCCNGPLVYGLLCDGALTLRASIWPYICMPLVQAPLRPYSTHPNKPRGIYGHLSGSFASANSSWLFTGR